MKSRKTRIVCECGKYVTANTIHSHIKKCNAPDSYKKLVTDVLCLCKKYKNRRPYLIPCDANSTALSTWASKVLNKEILLESLFCGKVRQPCCPTPSAIKKMSQNRTGKGNPVVRAYTKNIKYTLFSVKDRAKILVNSTNMTLGQIARQLEAEYPKYRYLVGPSLAASPTIKKRGYNKNNFIWSYLLDIAVEHVLEISRKRRGILISRGQKKSDKFVEFASRQASEMSSTWRVSKPHRRLFELVLRYDKNATMEHKIKHDSKMKSYDIFSPEINALIEMHGHIWHAHNSKNFRLKSIVERNINNDKIKRDIANLKGMRYIVFWDDQESSWPRQLERLYEKNKS